MSEKKYKYKAIIFDLDGVICHTDQYHYKAWKTIADELKIPFNETVNNKLRGVSRMESLELILKEGKVTLEENVKEALATKKNTIYRKYLEQMTPEDLDKAVLETLNQLEQMDVKMAIGSSSRNAPLILEKLELLDKFDAIVDGNCITKSKPDPEVFEKARLLLGLKKEECVVVEDAFSGIEAAKNAGLDCIGIGDARKSSNATDTIDKLSDLVELRFFRED